MSCIKLQILSVLMILALGISSADAEVVNKVLAHVGGKVITSYDVLNLDPKQYQEVMSIKDEAYRAKQLAAYTDSALEYLINQEIVAISAAREGVSVSDAEADDAINEILTRNKIDEAQLSEYLEKEGLSLAKYRFQLKNDILNSRVRSQVLMPKIVVVERDLREIVDSKPDEFPFHDKYELSILLMSGKDALTKVVKEIKSGLSFEEAVKKYSIDRSASNGGAMGWMEAEIMSRDMLAAVKDTKIGQVSAPFEVKGQWAVCKLLGFKSKYDFDDESRVKVTDAASAKIFEQIFKTWLDRNKETIVVLRNGEKPSAAR